jgi:hypothetical protein
MAFAEYIEKYERGSDPPSFSALSVSSVVRHLFYQTSVLDQLHPFSAIVYHFCDMPDAPYSKRCWFTFPTRTQVEQPILWEMSRKFPDVSFDIRQASVQNEIGIMAVLLKGKQQEVIDAIAFMRSRGVTVEPIEKSVVEG